MAESALLFDRALLRQRHHVTIDQDDDFSVRNLEELFAAQPVQCPLVTQNDERVVIDGQEWVLGEGVPLMADRPGVPISLQLDLEVVQRQRHVGEQIVDRGLGGAVGDQFIAGEPDLTLSGAALDDSVAETHHLEQVDTCGDLEGLRGRRA